MTACLTCPRTLRPDETGAGLWACRACIAYVEAVLLELPVQLVVLEACLEPEGAPRAGSIHGSRGGRLPLREDALTLVGPGHHVPLTEQGNEDSGGVPVTAALEGWARHAAQALGWHAERHPAGHTVINRWADPWPRHGATAEGWTAWLLAYLPQAAGREWFRAMRDELDDLLGRVRAITRIAPWARTLDAPCPDCRSYDLTEAWAELHITCGVCGTELTPEQYRAHAASLARTAVLILAARHHQEQEPA